MCMMLYMGSDNELPIVKWHKGTSQAVCVDVIPEYCAGLKKHLTKKFQYNVVAGHMGCACGFAFDEAEEIDDIDKHGELCRAAVGGLFDYIKKYVTEDNCELVSCWTGDEEDDLECKEVIKINEFDWKNRFSFLMGQYIKILN